MWRRTMASAGVLPTAYYSSDPFDFILEECGNISAAQAAVHRRSRFLREEEEDDALPADAPGLADHVVYRLFGSESFPCPDPSSSRRCSDAAAAELALIGYFLRLGPRRLHLLLPRHPPPHGKEGEGRRTGPSPSSGGKGKASALKRKLDSSSFPPPPFVSMADDRAVKKKPPYAQPNVPVRTGDESSSQAARRVFAGDTGPSPSVEIERGPRESKKGAESTALVPDLPVEKAGGSFLAYAINVETHDLGETRASGPRPPCSSALVQRAPPCAAGGDALSLATFVDMLLRFSKNNPGRILEDVDLLDVLAAKSVRLPDPEWWRPSGYGPSSSSSPPGDDHR
ncbi:unnamed protein product [Spirodela intermedia]|uniref:Uncharacterized protein n=1 Tax=Spirodela intermedia TaxID=51605 RepID=A0A7I8KA73_SPIIN|nr:unnamed protein product [Spirodela intermedia]